MQNVDHKNCKNNFIGKVLISKKKAYLHFGEHAGALRWRSRYDFGLFYLLKTRNPLPLRGDPVYWLRSFSQCTSFSLITKHILKPTKQTETTIYYIDIRHNIT